MTAQIGDKFKFKGSEYTIVNISNPIEGTPEKYGIVPSSVCTACWRGYWCVYNILENGIKLQDLYVNSDNDYYPEINGISPLCDNKKPNKIIKCMGHHLYKDINISIKYTGKILVGNDFIEKYYIHMGLQPAWAYKTLIEFIFQDSMLIDIIDHSKTIANLRKELDKNPNEYEKILSEFSKVIQINM